MRAMLCLAAMLLPAGAAAQNRTPAPPSIAGEIAASDRVDAQQRRYDEYAVEVAPGQRVSARATPDQGSAVTLDIEVRDHAGNRVPGGSAMGSGAGASLASDGGSIFLLRVAGRDGTLGRYRLRMVDDSDEGMLSAAASSSEVAPRGPVSRFIICPGHRRCQR